MATNIQILRIATRDENGVEFDPAILTQALQQQVPIDFILPGGGGTAQFYVGGFEIRNEFAKNYYYVTVFEQDGGESTNKIISSTAVDTYDFEFSASNGTQVETLEKTATIGTNTWHTLSFNAGGVTQPSNGYDEWASKFGNHAYRFGKTPNYPITWHLSGSHRIMGPNANPWYVNFGLVTLNEPTLGINNSWIRAYADEYYGDPDPEMGIFHWGLSQSDGPEAAGVGPVGPVQYGSWTDFEVSGTFEPSDFNSSSMYWPAVRAAYQSYAETGDRYYQIKGLHIRLSYPDTTVAFQYNTTNTQIVPVASESQNINTLAQQAGGALGGIATCTTNPFRYSDADILMNNAIVGRPSSYLMDVDYNQADGGTTTTQLMPSSSIVGANGVPMNGLINGYDVGVLTDVVGTVTSNGGTVGSGGRFDITIGAGGLYQTVESVKVSTNNGASTNYYEGQQITFTQAQLNAASTATGTGGITNNPGIIRHENLFSYSPTVPVNIVDIIDNTAIKAAVPDSNYTSRRIIDPRYNGCELYSADYNFYTGEPSASKQGKSKIPVRYAKGIKGPYQSGKLLYKNKVRFFAGNTGSYKGDKSYGKSAVIDNRPIYFAHFKSSHQSDQYFGSSTYAIDSLIAVPTQSITKFNNPTAEIIQLNGNNESLLDVSSTFWETRKVGVVYNNPTINYNVTDWDASQTGSTVVINYTSLNVGSNRIIAGATEFQTEYTNQVNERAMCATQSFTIPIWYNGLGNIASVQQYQSDASESMNYIGGIADGISTSDDKQLFKTSLGSVNRQNPIFEVRDYKYCATAFKAGLSFYVYNSTVSPATLKNNTTGYNGGAPGTSAIPISPSSTSGAGIGGLFKFSIQGGGGGNIRQILNFGEDILEHRELLGKGYKVGDTVTFNQTDLNQAFPSGGGTGEIIFIIQEDMLQSPAFGEDLGILELCGPVTQMNNVSKNYDWVGPNLQIMQSMNNLVGSGSIVSDGTSSYQGFGYEQSLTGYNYPIEVVYGWCVGCFPLGNIIPAAYQFGRGSNATDLAYFNTGSAFGGFFNMMPTLRPGEVNNPNQYWSYNYSESQVGQYEDFNQTFNLEVGDEIRVTYTYTPTGSSPKQLNVNTQDFTIVDTFDAAPAVYTNPIAPADFPAAGGTMWVTCSHLPKEGVYSAEELFRRYQMMATESCGDEFGVSPYTGANTHAKATTNGQVFMRTGVSLQTPFQAAQGGTGSGSIMDCRMLESTNPSSPFFNADYGPESTGSIALQISMSFPPSYSSTDSNYMAIYQNQYLSNYNLSHSLWPLELQSKAGLSWVAFLSTGSYGTGLFSAVPADTGFLSNKFIVHPDPRRLKIPIPGIQSGSLGQIHSATVRKRIEADDRVVVDIKMPSGSYGINTPTGDGYLIPDDLSPQQLRNTQTLIKQLKAKRNFTDDNIKKQ